MSTAFASLSWSNRQKYLFRVIWIFVGLFMITLSESTTHIPSIRIFTDPIFEQLVRWTTKVVFNIQEPIIYQLTSDSVGSFVHVIHIALFSLIGAWFWGQIQPNLNYQRISYWSWVAGSYYLSLQLYLYGFNKVFKYQFFLPEPNTLYTLVGETPKDLLFWTVMGSSYGYTVFGGLLEVLAASLLLFRKTRLLGALFSLGIMGNVVAINFGFNISVKLYSSFLLLLSALLTMPFARPMYAFFIHQKQLNNTWFPDYQHQPKNTIRMIVKILVIWLLLFESLAMYFIANNFNDDLEARPPFHGAYEVVSFVRSGTPCPPLAAFSFRWKRAFVHRRGYFVVQTMDDEMQDYYFIIDKEEQQFLLEHTLTRNKYALTYKTLETGILLLEGAIEGRVVQIRLKELDWRDLPLLKKEFHWFIDNIK